MIIQEYKLNLIPDKVPVIVNCSQYDSLSRTISFSIYNGASLFDIPIGVIATVRGTKSDNTGFEYACTVDGSKVSFDLTDQMTLFAGKVPCEIRLADSSGIIGTCNFLLNVEETPLDPDVTVSETDLPLLEEAEQNAIRAEQARDEAEQLLDTKQDVLTAGNGITLVSNVISNSFGSLTSPNLNEQKSLFFGYVVGATNYPTGTTGYGFLAVIPRNDSYTQQFYTVHGTNIIYTRYNENGTWGDWLPISQTAGEGIRMSSSGELSNTFTTLSSVDLNDIKYNFRGFVFSSTNGPSGQNANGILDSIFSLSSSGSLSHGMQIYKSYLSDGDLFVRRYNVNDSTWSSWVKLYSASSLTAGDGINITSGGVISNRFTNLTGVNLNTVKYNCLAWCNDACTNLPKNYGGMLLSCFSSNNSSYGTQVFASYAISGKGVFYRRYSGGTWSDWAELVSEFGSTQVPSANLTNCTGTIYLRASGQMVMIDFSTSVKCTTGGSGWVKLFQLPNGFTPVARQKLICIDDSSFSSGLASVAEARVDTDGSFNVYNAITGHNYWGGTMIYLRSI